MLLYAPMACSIVMLCFLAVASISAYSGMDCANSRPDFPNRLISAMEEERGSPLEDESLGASDSQVTTSVGGLVVIGYLLYLGDPLSLTHTQRKPYASFIDGMVIVANYF